MITVIYSSSIKKCARDNIVTRSLTSAYSSGGKIETIKLIGY